MDYEYLQNVMGSPYVNEGAFGQLKAKTAQAMGAAGTMAGHQIQNPTETKLRSLWEGFMSSLKKAMKDWESQVAPMFDEQVPLNEKQKQAKDALDTLARLLSSTVPQKIGTAPDDAADPGVRTQRRNPDTFVKGSAYNRSTTSPSKLTELIDEGFWDAAKRDIGLNKSLGSNDPSTILDSYKNHVISIFQGFMKDAVKMTKMTAQQIYGMLAKMQPSKQGWQAAGNMQKTVEQLKVLQGLGDIKGQGAPPMIPGAGVPPVIPQQQPPTPPQQPTTAGQLPPTAGQPPPTAGQPPEQTSQKPSQQPSGQESGTQGVSGGEEKIQPKEYPYIILHAIRIINDAVTSDISHVGKFFSEPQLPTDFTGASLTKESIGWLLKEIHSDPKPKTGTTQDGTQKSEPEVPGEFLYNFHSKFSKFPGQNFSINVKPVKLTADVPELPGVKIEVLWNCAKELNRIYVIAEKNGKKSAPLMIMQFYDHHVASEAGATKPGTNQFSIEKLVQSSDPNTASKLAGTPPQILDAIKKEGSILQRALMATTYRKSMEFKSKYGKNIIPIKWDEATGAVTYQDEKSKQWVTIDKTAVKNKLKGDYEDAKRWSDSLEHYGYFDKFEGMKPKDIEQYPVFVAAQTKMLQQGKSEATANKLLSDAWMKLSKQMPQDEIKLDDLMNLASGTTTPAPAPPPTQPPQPPASTASPPIPQTFIDAKMALEKLGLKPDIVKKKLTQAWMDLAATKPEKDITASELVALVTSGKKPQAAPAPAPAPAPTAAPPTPVSKPAGAPPPSTPPTAPVSKPASGPAPTTDPTAPVSTGTPEPDKGKQPANKSQAKGNANPEEKHGKVAVSGNDIEWEHPKTHEVHTISPEEIEATAKKHPKFAAALKAHPELYNKYKEKIDKQQGGSEKPPVKEQFTYINPFNRDNFLS